MIDQNARNRFLKSNESKSFMDGIFSSTSEALKLKQENQDLMQAIVKKDDLISQSFDKLGKAVAMIYKSIPQKINLPKIFQVEGKVEVTKSPDLKVTNLTDLSQYFKSLEDQIKKIKLTQPNSFVVDNLFELKDYFSSLEGKIASLAQAISSVPAPKIEFPKIEFPKMEKSKPINLDLSEVTQAIQNLEDSLKENSSDDNIRVLRLIQEGINNLVNKPTFIPPATTKVDINPLRGQFTSALTVVGTTPTAIPSNAATRRNAIIVFNEDTSTTLRLGGAAVVSTVAVGNKTGIAVPPQTYSPPFSAGPGMILYGIVASGTINVTSIEPEGDYGTLSTSVGNV